MTTTSKPKPAPTPPRPHAGVDRRRKDMRGRKYAGTSPISGAPIKTKY